MVLADHTFDQRGLNTRNQPGDKPAVKQSHFRVHLADGTKHDVLAACAADAQKYVTKRNAGTKITKTKLIRGEISA